MIRWIPLVQSVKAHMSSGRTHPRRPFPSFCPSPSLLPSTCMSSSPSMVVVMMVLLLPLLCGWGRTYVMG